jgi:hypothetical protein
LFGILFRQSEIHLGNPRLVPISCQNSETTFWQVSHPGCKYILCFTDEDFTKGLPMMSAYELIADKTDVGQTGDIAADVFLCESWKKDSKISAARVDHWRWSIRQSPKDFIFSGSPQSCCSIQWKIHQGHPGVLYSDFSYM